MEVGEGEYRVDEEEHEVGVWVGRGCLEGLEISKEMRGLVEGALEWGGRHLQLMSAGYE